MRVLAVGNWYPPAAGGGYERIFAGTVAALRAAGHEVRVLSAGGDGALAWYWRDGDFFVPSWRERRAIARRNRELMAPAVEWADVVSWWGMGGMPLSLLEVGRPAVGVVGDGWMVYGPRVDRWSHVDLGAVARWIFISRIALERAAELHRLPRAEVVHPGVDPAAFPPAPAREWAWRLACVGRVAPGKGVETARAAVALLPEATLAVDGPGGDVQTPSDRVHETYAAADAVLFPVEWPEPWGLVPLEAMSVGRPVVATGTGGSGEYLEDGRNCLLFAPGDAEGLAAAVRRLAADPGLRARLVAGGRATAARFSQPAFEAAVVRALEEEARR